MKTILSTGNNVSGQRGHTFLELMVTVSILSIGIVGVFQALLISLDYQNELSRRLYAITALEHEMALLENKYQITGELPSAENGKVIDALLDRREVPLTLTASTGFIQGIEGLLPLETALTWPDRGRSVSIKRLTYFVNLNIKPPANVPLPQQP